MKNITKPFVDEGRVSLVNNWSGMHRIFPAIKAVSAIVLALLGIGTTGQAEPSQLSKDFENYMVAHHYVAVGLESGGTNTQWVRAKINGKTVVLEVDTGCDRTCLTYHCAHSLGLDIHDTGEDMWGAGGVIKGKFGLALIKSFTLPFGEVNRTNTIEVLPKAANTNLNIDGYLGADILALNAAIYPIGGPRHPAQARADARGFRGRLHGEDGF